MVDISALYSCRYDFIYSNKAAFSKRYIVATSPRSGSSFLATLLYHRVGFGLPLEYFNIDSMAVRYRSTKTSSMQSYYEHVVRVRTDPRTGLFGAKMFARYAIMMRDSYPDLFRRLFDGGALILLVRRDIVAQSISLVRARQTARWFGDRPEAQQPRYDRVAIANALRYIRLNEKWWSDFAEAQALPFISIFYEDIVSNSAEVLKSLANFLNVEGCENRVEFDFSLVAQSDEINIDWSERFAKEHNFIDIRADAQCPYLRCVAAALNRSNGLRAQYSRK